MNREYRIICTKFGVDAGSRFCHSCERHDDCTAVDLEDRVCDIDFEYVTFKYRKPYGITKYNENVPIIYRKGNESGRPIGFIDKVAGEFMYVVIHKSYAYHTFTLREDHGSEGLICLVYERGEI